MKKILITILLIPVIWLCLPKQEKLTNDSQALEEYIPALMSEAAIPGLAIAKISDGKRKIYTFGKANLANNKDVSQDTLFNIASISKPIMGITLLQLVDDGLLDLDKDINDYLPFKVNNPKTANEVITLRHLVTHTSGIADYYDTNSYAINQDANISLEEHLKSLLTPDGQLYNQGEYFLAHSPGTKRKYSNLGAALAGYLVETTTGNSLANYSKQTLFEPLKMHQTSWLLNDISLNSVATPYEVETCVPFLLLCADTESAKVNHLIGEYFNPPAKNKHFHPYPHFGNPQYPDGGVRTSIKELSQFLVYLLDNKDSQGNKILSDKLYKEMLTLQLPEEVSDSQRIFWRDNNLGLTGHMGSDLGVFTAMYFDPTTKTGYIILMNRGADAKAGDAMKKIFSKLAAVKV